MRSESDRRRKHKKIEGGHSGRKNLKTGENSRKSIKGHIQRRHESAKIGKKLIVYIHLKKEPVTDRF